MKKQIFILLTLSFLVVTTGSVANAELRIRRIPYRGRCQVTIPLSTYDNCSAYSYYGRQAIECAEEDALRNCSGDDEAYHYQCNIAQRASYAYKENIPGLPGWTICVGESKVYGHERY